MKTWIITLFLVMFSLPALSNDIYIDQIGDTLDLDITQDGTNNQFGDSTTDVTLAGDDMTFAITQTGNLNVIDAIIKGANYTGTWTFTGNSNTVDLKCSSASTGKCDDVTLNITTTGDDNAYTVYVGETDQTFDFNFKVENIKIIPGAYDVVISSKLLSEFTNKQYNLKYFIALEPDSTFG